jgi:eukaryotic-like serine/threonine-protein kinase
MKSLARVLGQILGAAALIGGIVVVAGMGQRDPLPGTESVRSRWLTTLEEVAQFFTDGGVAEESIARPQSRRGRILPAILSLGSSIPVNPLPGQRTPPCRRGETVINRGCWIGVEGEKPPCGDTMYDYEGHCYFASGEAPRMSTSGTP